MNEEKKSEIRKPKRPYKRVLPFLLISEKLDNNKEIRNEFLTLQQRGNVTIDDMKPLRKRLEPILRKLKLDPLSFFWDEYLLIAVRGYPKAKLSKFQVGTATTKCTMEQRTKEPLWIIEVYPESNRWDILSAYNTIREFIPKRKLQPTAKKYHKLKLGALGTKEIKQMAKKLPDDSAYKQIINKAIK